MPKAEEYDFEVGDIIMDDEIRQRDPDVSQAPRGIVVNRPGGYAWNTTIPELDKTVAELNPNHPGRSPVVTVAFARDLDKYAPGWREKRPETLLAHILHMRDEWGVNIRTYDYPQSRLDPAPETEVAEI